MNEHTARHLRHALASHASWCRTNAVEFPPELQDLLVILATTGQRRPPLGDERRSADDPSVLLCLTYAEAGRRMGTSDRTVRRLVASGQLRSVRIGGCARIKTDDLAAYVAGLENR